MKTSIRAINNKLVVKQDEVASVTKHGILLPANSKEKPKTGIVESIGKEVDAISKGDRVVFSSFAGVEIKINEQDFLILKEEEVLAILE